MSQEEEQLPIPGSTVWDFATLARYVLHRKGVLMSELKDDEKYHLASGFILGRVNRDLRDDLTVMAYVDDKVLIVGSTTGTALAVERRSNRNPVLNMAGAGRVIRYHGEARLVMNRLRALARETLLHDDGEKGVKVEYQWRRKPSSKYVPLIGKDG